LEHHWRRRDEQRKDPKLWECCEPVIVSSISNSLNLSFIFSFFDLVWNPKKKT
jgi:hypothetical protein